MKDDDYEILRGDGRACSRCISMRFTVARATQGQGRPRLPLQYARHCTAGQWRTFTQILKHALVLPLPWAYAAPPPAQWSSAVAPNTRAPARAMTPRKHFTGILPTYLPALPPISSLNF